MCHPQETCSMFYGPHHRVLAAFVFLVRLVKIASATKPLSREAPLCHFSFLSFAYPLGFAIWHRIQMVQIRHRIHVEIRCP